MLPDSQMTCHPGLGCSRTAGGGGARHEFGAGRATHGCPNRHPSLPRTPVRAGPSRHGCAAHRQRKESGDEVREQHVSWAPRRAHVTFVRASSLATIGLHRCSRASLRQACGLAYNMFDILYSFKVLVHRMTCHVAPPCCFAVGAGELPCDCQGA
jgi:hypothetical protein